jgi:hydrogenase expression/formation protein HypD
MKFIDEYRDPKSVTLYADVISKATTRPWSIMEICGGQTHAIVRSGIDQLLPPSITLLHGPGCPVCVTPAESIDKAIALASRDDVTLCSFGDMIRVPGSTQDIASAKALGADVRMVYSPMDALEIAATNPDRKVVFFAIGFETTAPGNAAAVAEAKRCGIRNFSLLTSQFLVPPAIEAILSSEGCTVQAFLAAGHVCTIMGYDEYEPIAQRYRIPIVVTGFEPLDIIQGIAMAVLQLEQGTTTVENQYVRAVRREGNPSAKALLKEVFEAADGLWRGLGVIPASRLRLRDEYAAFDAERKFDVKTVAAESHSPCVSGEILKGRLKPSDCPEFGIHCSPESPLGATMVSSEGACAAYYRYRAVRK